MKYQVTMTETVSYTMEIEADCASAALLKADELANNNEFNTDTPELEDRRFHAYNVNDEDDKGDLNE